MVPKDREQREEYYMRLAEAQLEEFLNRLLCKEWGIPRPPSEIQRMILNMPRRVFKGATYISEFLGPTTCLAYVASPDGLGRIEAVRRNTVPPSPDDIVVMPTCVSLCGTDVGLIEQLKKGKLNPQMLNLIAGHEMAGFIVAVGKNVDPALIGQFMCFESHYACSRHKTPYECLLSGEGCDGIVSIRGSKKRNGKRNPPRDGYWGPVVTVPASSMTISLPMPMVEYLRAPSVLESLGNIWEIIETIKELELIEHSDKKLLIVVGLGATGYPLALAAKQYGFNIIGVDPVARNRELVEKNGIGKAFISVSEAETYIRQTFGEKSYDAVITAVMTGHERAYSDTFALQHNLVDIVDRRVLLAFGLFSNETALMPEMSSDAAESQRDFVLNGHSFWTNDKLLVRAVRGRSKKAWKNLIIDLGPGEDGVTPKNPALVTSTNNVLASLPNVGYPDFGFLRDLLFSGISVEDIVEILTEANGVKAYCNLLEVQNKLGYRGWWGSDDVDSV